MIVLLPCSSTCFQLCSRHFFISESCVISTQFTSFNQTGRSRATWIYPHFQSCHNRNYCRLFRRSWLSCFAGHPFPTVLPFRLLRHLQVLHLQVVFAPLLEASAVSSVNSVKADWSIRTISAGITVMNDDMECYMGEPSLVDFSNEFEELDATILPTDFDSPFEVISSNDHDIGQLGPSHPLPKMKTHTRVVRPRVEPRRILRNGVPTLSDVASSSNTRCLPQLHVSMLERNSERVPPTPGCPKSVTWLSVDDLTPQPPPPGGRSVPVSLRSGMDRHSLEAIPVAASSHQQVLKADVSGKSSFNPPQQHRGGTDSTSARTLVRTKQPSSNKHIVQLFQTLLSVFGAASTLGSQLSTSSFGDMHLHRVIDSYAASTLMKYLSAVGNFIRTCKELGASFLEISALQLADILITVQLSKSSDTAGCSSTGTLQALRWWQKVAGIHSWKPILFAPVIQSFLTIRIPGDRSESVPIPLWCIVQWEKRVLTSACPEPMVLILGFFLLLIWGSLRFSDAQRVDLRSLVYDGEISEVYLGEQKPPIVAKHSALSLKAWWANGVSIGFTNTWSHWIQFWQAWEWNIWTISCQMFQSNRAFWFHCNRCRMLRLSNGFDTASKQQQSTLLDPAVFTIHSCKATLLSWSAQQAHLLTEEERLQQGHHRISAKGSLRLYSRDDVYPALRLQGLLWAAILQGWRPSVPQHRGSQSALTELRVDTIEQYSKLGSMDFHWFGFGTPQPLEGISTPPPSEDPEASESSSSSSSSESDAPMKEDAIPKKKKSTPKPRATHTLKSVVGLPILASVALYDSRCLWTRIQFILARFSLEISLWTSVIKNYSDDGYFSNQPDPSFLQPPGLPPCLGVYV